MSDQSLRCPHKESLCPWLAFERTAKTDQTGQMSWSESSLGARVILLVLSCGGSFYVFWDEKQQIRPEGLYAS